jgi:diacylglycerol kinase family enzyme
VTWRILVNGSSDPGAIAAELRAQSVAHRFVETEDLMAAVVGEISAGNTRIAVSGGDPELAAVVAAVAAAGAEGRVDVALLPGATRSQLVRTFALDTGLGAAVGRMLHGTPYPIDAGTVEGGFGRIVFVNSVASGVLAGGPGWFPYWPRPLRMAGPVIVRSGASAAENIALGTLVLNGQFWGDWIGAPRSTLVDGVVDLQVFSGRRRTLSRLRPAFRTGMHVRATSIRRLSVAAAEVTQPDAWWVAVDGMRVGRGGFRLTVLPGVVRLAV